MYTCYELDRHAMTTVLRQKSVRFDLKGKECETPFLATLLLARLEEQYVGTCLDRGYVRKIVRIVGEPAPRVWSTRHMYGEMWTSVIFEYEAEVWDDAPGEPSSGQTILHGGEVVEITEAKETVLLTCTIGDHVTASVLVDRPGVVTTGMIVPIRVLESEYPQNIMNTVSITGMLLSPGYYDARYLAVAEPTPAELTAVRDRLAELNTMVALIVKMARAQYFKAWLFPYRLPPRTSASLPALLSKTRGRPMCVMVDDACDPSGMEFVITGRNRLAEPVSFTMFGEMLISDARRRWDDIAKFSATYKDAAVFDAHKTVWAYYEGGKKESSEEHDRIAMAGAKKRPPKETKAAGGADEADVAAAMAELELGEADDEPPQLPTCQAGASTASGSSSVGM